MIVEKYVAINLRTGSYYKIFNFTLRNTDPKKYLSIINYLKKRGFKVICFNNEIQDFKNLHDVFIFSEKIKFNIHEMQIYVMKNADIFITNMFGPRMSHECSWYTHFGM